MPFRRSAPTTQVHSISTLPTSVADDQDERMRSYLISMGVRTACFVLATGVFMATGIVWLTLLLGALAVVLPYPAVVWANNTGNKQLHEMQPVAPTYALPSGESRP